MIANASLEGKQQPFGEEHSLVEKTFSCKEEPSKLEGRAGMWGGTLSSGDGIHLQLQLKSSPDSSLLKLMIFNVIVFMVNFLAYGIQGTQ